MHQLPPGSLSSGDGTSISAKGHRTQEVYCDPPAAVSLRKFIMGIVLTVVVGGLGVIAVFFLRNCSLFAPRPKPGMIASY